MDLHESSSTSYYLMHFGLSNPCTKIACANNNDYATLYLRV